VFVQLISSKAGRAPKTFGHIKIGFLEQDRFFEPTEIGGRFNTELFSQDGAEPLVASQCFRLAVAPIQSHHQLCPQPLPERVLGYERLELRDNVGVTPAGDVGVDPVLEGGETQFNEPTGF
jgi:hypothetical protein